jgi:maltose-binding protein MalE
MKEFMEKNPNYKTVTTQLDRGIFEPAAPFWELIRTVITDEVEAILNGRREVEEALDHAMEKSKLIIDSLE